MMAILVNVPSKLDPCRLAHSSASVRVRLSLAWTSHNREDEMALQVGNVKVTRRTGNELTAMVMPDP